MCFGVDTWLVAFRAHLIHRHVPDLAQNMVTALKPVARLCFDRERHVPASGLFNVVMLASTSTVKHPT